MKITTILPPMLITHQRHSGTCYDYFELIQTAHHLKMSPAEVLEYAEKLGEKEIFKLPATTFFIRPIAFSYISVLKNKGIKP